MLWNESQPYRVPWSKYEWLSRYGLLENFDTGIPHLEHVLDFDVKPHPCVWALGFDVMERKSTLQSTYGPSMSVF